MWNSLMHFDVAPLNLVIRALVVYLSVLILLRISGKKQMGQMGATEFVAILLISNAVQNSMNGGDNSLAGGLVLAFVLIVASSLISYLTYKSKIFSSIFEGTPTLLIHEGKMIKKNLEKERLSENELRTLLRKDGVHEIHLVKTAILESDGKLTLFKFDDGEKSSNGKISSAAKAGPGDDCTEDVKE